MTQKAMSKNEGEGNRTADRKYRESATRHAASGASKKGAQEAKSAIEGEEGKKLRAAEAAGKAGKKRS